MDDEERKVDGARNPSRGKRPAARGRFRRCGDHVEVFFGDETVEIAVEAPEDPTPSDKRRFALLNVPRELFNKALGDAARRSKSERPAILGEGR